LLIAGVAVPKRNNHIWYPPRSSSLAHCSRPANDRFLAGADSPIAGPTVLGKRAFCPYRTHSYAGLSSSNSNTSPTLTPSAFRMAIFACFSTAKPPDSLLSYAAPYFGFNDKALTQHELTSVTAPTSGARL
jgi:hypothetical protein